MTDKLEALQISVKEKTNHKVLSLERGRKVTYECGTCGKVSKGPQYCSNCAHDNYNQTCFLRKPFTFPSGRVDNVGHEPLALKELLNHYRRRNCD